MKSFCAALFFVWSGLASAQDTWIRLIGSADGAQIYYGMRGSYEVSTNKAGDQIVVMTEKIEDTTVRKIELQKIYVRTQDCIRKMGKAVILSIDGTYKYEFDFIFDAGSVGSYRAQFLCEILLKDLKEKAGKGI